MRPMLNAGEVCGSYGNTIIREPHRPLLGRAALGVRDGQPAAFERPWALDRLQSMAIPISVANAGEAGHEGVVWGGRGGG